MRRLFLAILGSMLAIHSHGEGEEKPLRLVLTLTDGSRIVGTTSLSNITVHTEFCDVDLRMDRIRSLTMRDDRETAELRLRNRDRLTAVPRIDEIDIHALFGDVSVPLVLTEQIVFLGRAAAARPGLCLANSLDSKAVVTAGEVGPAGSCRGGKFVRGVAGNCLRVRHDENGMIEFPGEVVSPRRGCIELWARLDGVPATLAWGENPGLFRLYDKAIPVTYQIHLNGNDGGARGGICARSPGGSCGTGRFGSWTYAKAIGNVGAWHHYALVWDVEGIEGVGDGTATVAVFLDGKLNGSEKHTPKPERMKVSRQPLQLMTDQHLKQGHVELDELRVWDFPKTDFSDRFEGVDDPVVLQQMP